MTAVIAFHPGRAHLRRLRDIYRSAGWPCHDVLEVELLAAGLLARHPDDTLRVTDAGIAALATHASRNRAAFSAHEALVERVAHDMVRRGRIAWRGLSLRAQVPGPTPDSLMWAVARPDVYSIRNTTVERYVQPMVHEVKVTRADLLGDLKRPAKRAAYLDMGECWYVLGADARGRPIADPSEVPPDCGVLIDEAGTLRVARHAAPFSRGALTFGAWMALAKATPVRAPDDDAQGLLGGC